MNLFLALKTFFTRGDKRSIKAKKNSLYMFFIHAANMFISLLLVPMTLNYVDNATYGIWLALSSMVLWIRILDIGINNGLKNKLAESFAVGDYNLAKKYVSTTYAILSLIFLPVMVILLIITPLLNWTSILNLGVYDIRGLVVSISIIISYFCFNFILSTINIVLYADQRPADANFRSLLQQIISLAVIFILTLTTKGDLVKLCLGLCASPLLIIILYNITLFNGRYKAISPNIKSVDFKVAPSLLSLGVRFFIIQICFIIQYQISNFLILRYYGAEDVTSYNIAFKYFNAIYSIWLILLAPLWAATTDALAKGEYNWVTNAIKKYTLAFICVSFVMLLMLLVASPVYRIWVGDKVEVPFSFSLWIMLYNLAICFGSIYINVLNGAGVLKVQTLTSIVSPIIFLFSFFVLFNMGIGVISVPIAGILSSINGLFFAPIQCYLLYIKRVTKKGLLFE